MRVLMVSSEMAPWAKTGGLADVVSALPVALESLGHEVTVVLPRYRGVSVTAAASRTVFVQLGAARHDVVLHSVELSPARRLVLVDCPALYDRAGLYGEGGRDYEDNAERFGVLAAAALASAEGDAASGRAPEIVHAHDWQAGLLPVLLRTRPPAWAGVSEPGLVFTIHNLAYQGLFPMSAANRLDVDHRALAVDTGEFWGQFSFLKAGITFSDMVTTVSPTYARETQGKEMGVGLDGVLRARADRYVGILNGIDTSVWNPADDPLLPAHFDRDRLDGKRACKRALLARFNLAQGDDALSRPVIGIVSRLADQKGFDLVAEAADELLEIDATWTVVGTGDKKYEILWRALEARAPARVGAHLGFDEGLAHLVEAGADMFLMPSRFEPCGLNQMYSLRYGTVPIVHGVGGLEDTVQPYTARARHANGFKFRGATAGAMLQAIRQAVRLYRDDPEAWTGLMRQGMSEDHGWDRSAGEYVRVYRRAARARREPA